MLLRIVRGCYVCDAERLSATNGELPTYTLTNVVAILSGNSLAMIAKLAVRKAALPKASIILVMNDSTIKV